MNKRSITLNSFSGKKNQKKEALHWLLESKKVKPKLKLAADVQFPLFESSVTKTGAERFITYTSAQEQGVRTIVVFDAVW